MNYIAITGALFGMGQDKERPHFPANLVGDFGGGSTYLVIGVLAALLEARLSGRGQVVDAAIVDGTAHLNTMSAAFLAAGNLREERAAKLLDGGDAVLRPVRDLRRQAHVGRSARAEVLRGARRAARLLHPVEKRGPVRGHVVAAFVLPPGQLAADQCLRPEASDRSDSRPACPGPFCPAAGRPGRPGPPP